VTTTDDVRKYWENEPCGTSPWITENVEPLSREWFARIEAYRYEAEPFVFSLAQFTRFSGKRILEVGVGAGADHVQWARAGCDCYGVDLTQAAIDTTRAHLAVHGLTSNLQKANAEALPFERNFFDVVWSFGVIHHAEHPERVIAEIHRVLAPGGKFRGMMYNRFGIVTFRLWVKHALLRARPWRSLSDVTWHHQESPGTKAYTRSELRELLGAFRDVEIEPYLTTYDQKFLPAALGENLPKALGYFLAFRCRK
jgi:SAM-dependent methyltransferase